MLRPLSDRERGCLDVLLSPEFPGVTELRAQADAVQAEGDALVVELHVPEGLSAANVVARVPVQATVDGAGYDGGLLLFVDDGKLSALEYWWVTEEAPATFPPVEAISQPVVDRGGGIWGDKPPQSPRT